MKTQYTHQRQRGAALIVGLLLLVVITVLAISGMNTATTELAIARNDQIYENTFQAAETGIENALSQGIYIPQPAPVVLPRDTISTHEYVDTAIQYENEMPPPPEFASFSIGEDVGVVAHYFLATATARSERTPGTPTDYDTMSIHNQVFFILGAQQNTLP